MCPVDGCASPYLTYHHFDPPWRIEKHNRVEGMIALCRPHADKADAGAFTDDQLRLLKSDGADHARTQRATGRFDFLRRQLIVKLGGVTMLDCPVLIEINGKRRVWVNRNDFGEVMLNVDLPRVGGMPRVLLDDNQWTVRADGLTDLKSPPGGRCLSIRSADHAAFDIEYKSLDDQEALEEVIGRSDPFSTTIEFPATLAVVGYRAVGSRIEARSNELRVDGAVRFQASVVERCGVGLSASLPRVASGRSTPKGTRPGPTRKQLSPHRGVATGEPTRTHPAA